MTEHPLPEHRETLWRLTFGPAIWAIHFLLCYVTAAVYCARWAGREGGLLPVQQAVAVFTVAALIGIGLTAWRGYQRHSYGDAETPHDFDSAADRHRFLGFATLLLCGLSAVATGYVALAAFFFESCR